MLNHRILLRKVYWYWICRDISRMTDSEQRQARTLTNIIVLDQARLLHRTYSLRPTITIIQMTGRLQEIPRAQINSLTRQVPVHILWLSSAGNESPQELLTIQTFLGCIQLPDDQSSVACSREQTRFLTRINRHRGRRFCWSWGSTCLQTCKSQDNHATEG